MGFLKRFLSLGGKKNKKPRPTIIHNVNLEDLPVLVDDNEAAANRLLRSSSSRYAVVAETDYSSLPPLPHPINNVLATPNGSTTSLTTPSINQRGTYSVRVHRREYHTRPDVGPDFDNSSSKTPKQRQEGLHADSSQLLRLRSDPSVVSLLDMYDEHGQLPSEVFSNSPTKQGRAQTKRSGSTLRQLLGSLGNDSGEGGDISWADELLQSDNASSTSSLPPQTPNDFDFSDNHLTTFSNANNDISFSDHDLSSSLYENPAISSMEVELSIGSELPSFDACVETDTPDDHKTPRRASQVFDFLANRRRSQISEADSERPLPELPSAFSSPSDRESLVRDEPHRSHFSDSSCDSPAKTSAIPFSFITDTHNHSTDPNPLYSEALPTVAIASSPSSERANDSFGEHSNSVLIHEGAQAHKVKIIMTAPTTVMVTAPTPSAIHNLPSRIPRGPRPQPQMRKVSYGNVRERRPSSRAHAKDDPFTPVPPRRRSNRLASRSSSVTENDSPVKVTRTSREKKNGGPALAVKPELPFTPVRTNTQRSSLFRTTVDPLMFRPPPGMAPSPASSSELSPVGQKLMLDVRQQRMKARERLRNGPKYRGEN
ncbi:hypothetical protein C8J56DRAFT_802986 [Mycena floridula]|nr:hypothetical protein C8J56DRAFT_802986 [Mycena floridula]